MVETIGYIGIFVAALAAAALAVSLLFEMSNSGKAKVIIVALTELVPLALIIGSVLSSKIEIDPVTVLVVSYLSVIGIREWSILPFHRRDRQRKMSRKVSPS